MKTVAEIENNILFDFKSVQLNEYKLNWENSDKTIPLYSVYEMYFTNINKYKYLYLGLNKYGQHCLFRFEIINGYNGLICLTSKQILFSKFEYSDKYLFLLLTENNFHMEEISIVLKKNSLNKEEKLVLKSKLKKEFEAELIIQISNNSNSNIITSTQGQSQVLTTNENDILELKDKIKNIENILSRNNIK